MRVRLVIVFAAAVGLLMSVPARRTSHRHDALHRKNSDDEGDCQDMVLVQSPLFADV